MNQKVALVVANSSDDDSGFVGDRLREHGYQLRTVHRDAVALPTGPGDADLVLLLGSEWSVHAPVHRAAVVAEAELARQTLAEQVPLLAICYGAQLLAHALGGNVRRAIRPEIGWVEVDSTDPNLVPSGPWLAFHTDIFEPPENSCLVATNAAGVQAFSVSGALAVQFHPEVRARTVADWLRRFPGVALDAGVAPGDLLAATVGGQEAARLRACALVDAFLSTYVPVATRSGVAPLAGSLRH